MLVPLLTVPPGILSFSVQIGKPPTGHTGDVYSLAFCPDRKTLASGSSGGPVQLWDVATGRQIGKPLTSDTGPAQSLAFSPDGKTLASNNNAARLATLPITTNAHGSSPPHPLERGSASKAVEAATIMPSTDSGVSAATHPGCPCPATSWCMCRPVPAITASSATHPVVVHPIHPSARPVTTGPPGPAHRRPQACT
jgi:WD40 repeat protein